MILHLVLFRLKPGVRGEDPRVEAVRSAMAGLPTRISEIQLWQFGSHLLPGGAADARAWDFGLLAGFEDEAALLRYFEHPEHVPVVCAWDEIAELAYTDLESGGFSLS